MFYQNYSGYLKEKYGKNVYRISIDGGFSCPNREKGREGGGCIFCDEAGSRAVYLRNDDGTYPESMLFNSEGGEGFPPEWSRDSVESQIKRALSFLKKRYQAKAFILYFQAYSGTYASPLALKTIYDHALSFETPEIPFRELVVSTRPDAIDSTKADLLASYITDSREVWCELGLQTASPRLLRYIKRGHTLEQFLEAYQLLKERGIKKVVHLITGLPTETEEERDNTISLIAKLRPEGIKIHNLNLVKNTELYSQWENEPFEVDTMDEHIQTLVYYLRRLPPETLIMRMTCDTDRSRLVLPAEKWNKSQLLQKLQNEMRALGAKQGDLFRG